VRLSESLMNSEESSYHTSSVDRGGGSEAHSDHWRNQHIPAKHPSRVSAHVEGAVEERQPTKTVTEEQEKTLKSSQEMEEEEEHST
jgi:hypothetical protein